MELLDFFDEQGNHLGLAPREEVHLKGYWHKTFHCWIIKKIEEQIFILFQKRSPHKKEYPNLYDITAAGHLLAGESIAEGARELSEELGITFQAQDLISLGVYVQSHQAGAYVNKEFCYTYFLESNLPLDQYQLQVEEVSRLVEIEISSGESLFRQEIDKLSVSGVHTNEQGILENSHYQIHKSDILPHPDTYYLKIFSLARLYFQGKLDLSQENL